ncbi:MAG: RNA polymerase sigma factor SigY [Clostridium sp.]|uniref:RNA polymerase sigma factor SigY n=1 Tax=Clostridium sp. TaxID=1506 RepID=UPI00305993DD
MDEKDLITKAQNGNKSALNTLLQNNYKSLYGFLIKFTGDIYLSEELVQDTLLRASLKINSFRGDCKFSSWIIQISINLYKNYVKKNQKTVLMETNIIDVASHYNGEDKIIDSLQLKEALSELQKMPYKKRIAFILKHYYGYSLEEISEILNIPTGTVKSRIHNTIKKLRESIC